MAKFFKYPITFPAAPSADTVAWKLKSRVKTPEDLANGGEGTESVADYAADAVDPFTPEYPENSEVTYSVAAVDNATPPNVGAYSATAVFTAVDTVPPGTPDNVSLGAGVQIDT
jgi:hypothetical protein